MITYTDDAIFWSKHWHSFQSRKYTGEPYFNHLQNVANKVVEWGYPELQAIAYLHDTVEDTGTSVEYIEMLFNKEIAQNVWYLTDVPLIAGNRATRNALNNARLTGAPEAALIVKCADMIDNMHDIVEHDPKFAKVYLDEMLDKAMAMGDALPYHVHKEWSDSYELAKEELK